eukprot:GHVR01019972.1.p1 GENE.GHVR01019972.1~~GHVR01019972.1.p1  ORF type:complete len:175 (+),score=45.37 GHVR01019972.1:48-572(+)
MLKSDDKKKKPTEQALFKAAKNSELAEDPIDVAERRRATWDDPVDVQVIPDLEEQQEEDITIQIAAPPVHHEQKLKPVTHMSQKNDVKSKLITSPPKKFEFDLSALMIGISPDSKPWEDDVYWDRDVIFQEISSDYNNRNTTVTAPVEENNPTHITTQKGVSVTSQGIFYDTPF